MTSAGVRERSSGRVHRLTWPGRRGPVLPGTVEILEAIHVTLPSGPVVPDNVVADADMTVNGGVSIDIEAVQLVVELVSPGNKAMDQKPMPMLYAKAANPHHRRLEFDPAPWLIITELEHDRYVEQTSFLSGEAACLDARFAIDLAGLARRQLAPRWHPLTRSRRPVLVRCPALKGAVLSAFVDDGHLVASDRHEQEEYQLPDWEEPWQRASDPSAATPATATVMVDPARRCR